ncbi:MAG TPA: hypothetical protein VLB04_06150 [Methanotrichaceae archaeon]|nr:hypothetical protein [Methanotrichaceae archaeon]
MIWRRRREARPIEPSQAFDPRLMELETATEILAEIFGVRAADADEMIQRKLMERKLMERNRAEECLWPATFSMGSSYGPEL